VLFRLLLRATSRKGGLSDPFEIGVNVSCIENFVNVRYTFSVILSPYLQVPHDYA
jgi:hypothetical protein